MIAGSPANVVDFGASSSATAAANTTAINAALASGAKTVIINNDGGIILVDGSINVPSGVTLIGVGLPTIKAANNAFPSGGAVISLASATSSNVDGLKIDANSQNNGASMYGINCVTCVKTSVTNNYVINTEYGIYFVGGNTLRIIGNTVDDCIFYGITVKLNDVLADCYDIVITDNECKNISMPDAVFPYYPLRLLKYRNMISVMPYRVPNATNARMNSYRSIQSPFLPHLEQRSSNTFSMFASSAAKFP
jgi:hypothetical protein